MLLMIRSIRKCGVLTSADRLTTVTVRRLRCTVSPARTGTIGKPAGVAECWTRIDSRHRGLGVLARDASDGATGKELHGFHTLPLVELIPRVRVGAVERDEAELLVHMILPP